MAGASDVRLDTHIVSPSLRRCKGAMSQTKPPLSIPPLSFEALTMLQNVLDLVSLSMRDSQIANGDALNMERATEVLRTCVVMVIDVKLNYYKTLDQFSPEWLTEIKRTTIDAIINCVPRLTRISGEPFRSELERTVEGHFLGGHLKTGHMRSLQNRP